MLSSRNHFLSSLSLQDADLLEPHLRPVELRRGMILHKANDSLREAYFPHDALISQVISLSNGQLAEVGVLGRNTLVGAGAILGSMTTVSQTMVQISGSGVKVDIGVLKKIASESEKLHIWLAKHQEMALAQTQQLVACNAFHELEERLSRWILQTRDLLQGDSLALTQDFLSQMLGVQRSTVTVAARKLQEAGLINYRRGLIQVADLESLRDSCCECYQAINDQLKHLINWVPV